jgi:hypothetical protein
MLTPPPWLGVRGEVRRLAGGGLQLASAGDSGLMTKPSKYSVPDTIERFEVAVKAKGWVVFTRLDHAHPFTFGYVGIV